MEDQQTQVPEQQSSGQEYITLLFLNTYRLSVPLSSPSSPSDVSLLKKYIIEHWSQDFISPLDQDQPELRPSSIDQIRMIHLGKPLSDEILINDLNLKMSDVIHVSFKPITRVESRGHSMKRGAGSGAENDGKKVATNSDEQHGGGCCIIA